MIVGVAPDRSNPAALALWCRNILGAAATRYGCGWQCPVDAYVRDSGICITPPRTCRVARQDPPPESDAALALARRCLDIALDHRAGSSAQAERLRALLAESDNRARINRAAEQYIKQAAETEAHAATPDGRWLSQQRPSPNPWQERITDTRQWVAALAAF